MGILLLFQFLEVEGDAQDQPLFLIVEVDIRDLADPVQAVEQSAPVDEQPLGGLQYVPLQFKERFQRRIQIRMVCSVIFLQDHQLLRAEELRGERLFRFHIEEIQKIIVKTVTPDHAGALQAEIQRGHGLIVSFRDQQKILDLRACPHFHESFPQKEGEAAQDVRNADIGVSQVDDHGDSVLVDERAAVRYLGLDIAERTGGGHHAQVLLSGAQTQAEVAVIPVPAEPHHHFQNL